MHQLFDCLEGFANRYVSTVVHIGAGNGSTLARYARLGCDRLVLVEGDPRSANALRHRVNAWRGAEVHATPVTADGASLAWHRYSLPALNGPAYGAALGDYYPRVRHTEVVELPTRALPELLRSVASTVADQPVADKPRGRVLVFDVPGQEQALLAALPQTDLLVFDLVVLFGCREPLQSEGSPAALAIDQLRQRGYELIAEEAKDMPLWPMTVLRFDPVRYQLTELEARLAAAESRVKESDIAAATALADRASLALLAQAQERARDELQARVAVLTTERAKFERELQAERERLGGALAASQDEHNRDAREQQAKFLALAQSKAEFEALAYRRHLDIEAQTAEVARLSAMLQTASGRGAELEATNARLRREVTEQDARQTLLDTQIVRAEAQLEFIAQVLLYEKNF